MMASGWEVMVESGREKTGIDVLEWIAQSQQLGAGEILVTSVDQDGTCQGPDQDLIQCVSKISELPLVVSGGFAERHLIQWALMDQSVSAVAIGAALHNRRITINDIKESITSEHSGILLRITKRSSEFGKTAASLKGMSVAIVDYGMGNQQSLLNALITLGASVKLTDDKEELTAADLRILPGVGAFPSGMEELKKRGLDQHICSLADQGKPLIGICLGMQLLFEDGVEFAPTQGLGLLPGHVISIADHIETGAQPHNLILPHMGWNTIDHIEGDAPQEVKSAIGVDSFYFVHSFAATKANRCDFSLFSTYGGRQILSLCSRGCVLGFQFHPERSGDAGLRLLAACAAHLCKKTTSNPCVQEPLAVASHSPHPEV
jgi:glutamine amidotransferase